MPRPSRPSSPRLLITGLFFSKQGTEEHKGARGSQSMVACPFRDFWQCLEKYLVLPSQWSRVGMLLSILKIHRLAPHNKELCGIACPQCWVWETAPRQWLSKCGPQIDSIFINWELDRNANSPRHLYGSTESQTLGGAWQAVGQRGWKRWSSAFRFNRPSKYSDTTIVWQLLCSKEMATQGKSNRPRELVILQENSVTASRFLSHAKLIPTLWEPSGCSGFTL